jgi:hypothetical protein
MGCMPRTSQPVHSLPKPWKLALARLLHLCGSPIPSVLAPAEWPKVGGDRGDRRSQALSGTEPLKLQRDEAGFIG